MVKLGFVTCVQLGLSCMQAIYEAGGKLELAITLHDEKALSKSGRVFIDDFCETNGIDLFKCNHVNDAEVIDKIRTSSIDWLFIIGWSQIASPEVLASANLGALGAHPTLLPTGRGRAAIPWAILKRLDKTGVTLFKLDAGVDTGEILDQIEIPTTDFITATELYERVNDAHIALMKNAVPALLASRVTLRPQDDSAATYWPGRKPEDGQIDLKGSVFDAECLIRAVTRPYPGAFINLDDGKLIIWSAEVADSSGVDGVRFKDGFLHLLDYEFVPHD